MQPVPQIILCSLVQQLAHDLTTESTLKLLWLHEVLPRFRPADPLIAPNVGRVLQQTFDNLQAQDDVFGDAKHPLCSQYHLVVYLVGQLLKQVA